MLLNFSSPIFIAPIAALWLHEPITRRGIAAVGIGFVGITLILKPGSGMFSLAALVGVCSGILAAVAMVSVRSLSVSEPVVRTVFYFTATSTVISGVPLLWAWQTPDLGTFAIMAAAGLFATKGQLLLTKSYSFAPAARIGPYSYSTVVFAALFGWLFWQETPDLISVMGATLVFFSGAVTMWARKPTPPAKRETEHP